MAKVKFSYLPKSNYESTATKDDNKVYFAHSTETLPSGSRKQIELFKGNSAIVDPSKVECYANVDLLKQYASVSFATSPISDIQKVVDLGLAPLIFKIGDSRTIGTYTYYIIDFNHDADRIFFGENKKPTMEIMVDTDTTAHMWVNWGAPNGYTAGSDLHQFIVDSVVPNIQAAGFSPQKVSKRCITSYSPSDYKKAVTQDFVMQAWPFSCWEIFGGGKEKISQNLGSVLYEEEIYGSPYQFDIPTWASSNSKRFWTRSLCKDSASNGSFSHCSYGNLNNFDYYGSSGVVCGFCI